MSDLSPLGPGRLPDRVLAFGPIHHEPLLTKEQLAAAIGFSKRWIDYRVREGMPFVPARGQKRFRLSEVLAWLRERRRV